ncbi:hypothetical protein Tco_1262348 [Tanacetum coccineum]
MPPKRNVAATTTTPMIDAQIKALISQGVADALAKRDAYRSRNGDDSHDSGSDGRRRMLVARECTYSDFLKCQPLNFKGTEGVVGLTQWFERMESVSHIRNCAVRNQVKYATCTLLGNALMWWNSHVNTVKGTDVESYTQCFYELALLCGRMFLEESDKVEKYVGGLPDMIQGSVMASKPKKMQDAVEFAIELMDQKIHTLAERQAKNKRKFEDTSKEQSKPTVFRIWKAFGGNTRDFGSFGEETDKTTNQHHDSSRFKVSAPGDGVTIYTRRRHTSSSDGVTTFLDDVSPHRLNSDLEDSTL